MTKTGFSAAAGSGEMTQDPFDALREQMVQVIAIYAHYSSEKLGKDTFDERVMEVLG